MRKTTTVRMWGWCATLVIAGLAPGCSSKGRNDVVASRRSALSTTNGLWQNGLTTNGLWQNGLWQNGLWQNGLWQNGLWQNGLWQNGLSGDAALPGNMLRNNAYARQALQYIYECAMPAPTYDSTGAAVTSYATSIDPNTKADGTGSIPCTPPGDGGTDGGADAGASCDVGYECSTDGKCVIPLRGAIGLAINDDGTTWWGAPAPGGATDTTTGKWGQCDESCQRWVSACVLARTNAYGVHVPISMRAPAGPPAGASPGKMLQLAAVQAALVVGPDEAAFQEREGAYYGNLFATTPFSSTLGPCTTLPDGTVQCQPTGPIVNTPSFYACAGPDSNLPEVTKRFCSSQGDQTVIKVPGVCVPRTTSTGATELGVCDGIDTTGSIHGCNTCESINAACLGNGDCCSNTCSAGRCVAGTSPSMGTHYDEVITVYLEQPMAVCGNGVCEAGEHLSEPYECLSDCHPGSWAKDYFTSFGEITYPGGGMEFSVQGLSAVGPDDSVVLLGDPEDNEGQLIDIDLGGGNLPASLGRAVLAKYDSKGNHVWSKRFGATPPGPGLLPLNYAAAVTVAPNGNIIVVGNAIQNKPNGYQAPIIYTFGPDGGPPNAYANGVTPVALAVLPVEVTATGVYGNMQAMSGLAIDSQGNADMTFLCGAPATLGSFSITPAQPVGWANPATYNFCVVKAGPQGDLKWARGLDGGATFPWSLAVDKNDDIVVVTTSSVENLQKLCGVDGAVIWSRDSINTNNAAAFTVATFDASGNVYAGGYFNTGSALAQMLVPSNPSSVFGGSIPVVTGRPPFIVKYDGAGAFQWVRYANVVCPDFTCSRNAQQADLNATALNISFDRGGNVILGSYGSVLGGGLDFGIGTFPTYNAPNLFLSAYGTQGAGAGSLLWAKQLPMIVKSAVANLGLDSTGRIVVSGAYTGSIQMDGDLLVTDSPEDPGTTDAYLASFAAPSTSDKTPPAIGFTTDQTGAPIVTVPSDIVAEATSKCGASVFFMPPTATDLGDPAGGAPAGVSVSCAPAPNTNFPIATAANPWTTVTCTATDPLGNASQAQFKVAVHDTVAPVFDSFADVTQAATDPNGAVVTFAPTAKDEVDCSTALLCVNFGSSCITPTCTPPSGSLFPVGQTTVTCTAMDAAQNQSQMKFKVNVTGSGIGSPCTSTAQCASGLCVDGVCCGLADPTATSCGQCQACNVPGSLGTCTATAGSCSDGNACTQNDTCQNGACVGGAPIACAASDQCHVAGTCDPATGTCSSPAAPNGTACSDGNACTQTDSCQAGVCVGGSPVTCAPSDQCHVAGACNPATGTCSSPAAPNGTACSDGNACTLGDSCQAGTCVGSTPVTCAPSDQCHVAGTCNPTTGACSNPPVANGTACNDGNACTTSDVCAAGVCTGGAPLDCDDQNPCTVDSCSGAGGCAHTPGNKGAVCRAATSACDSAETCTGTSAACPAAADKVAPVLAAGTNQTVVGTCSSAPLVFAAPALVGSCETGTKVTCTSVPGNAYGAHTVACTAKDAAGNVSAPVSFTVTVLQPLTVRVQPPLSGDNDAVDNVVKDGSTVPVKVQLFACGVNVTKTASVTAKLAVASAPSGGSTTTQTVVACSDAPNTNGVMVLDGASYHYNLSTKGYAVTAGLPAFFQLNVSVAYKSAPSVVVGSDAIELDTR
ncbi:MAG TPA: HYR domain-containing protein [Polyangia bacterium]|nr:HYR domain-containing protein [Polyangia bacterium]